MKVLNVNKLMKVGCIFKFWIVDWYVYLNNKMGGDFKKIKIIGEYFIEIWKVVGMRLDRVEFLWFLDEINVRVFEYWLFVMDIVCRNFVDCFIR